MFQITMLQEVLPTYSVKIKIQWPDLSHTPLIKTLPLDLVSRCFVTTCLSHRWPPGRGFVILKVFTVNIISVYVVHILDIFSNISHQLRCNTTPIGFGGWVEVLIKINRNFLRCYKLVQINGKLLRPAIRKLLNCNDFGSPIIISTGMP